MNAYFFKMNKQEKDNILDQHKHVYDGYVTKYNKESNQTPLYVQDLANDKNGITLNHKGVVKPYTNININEDINRKDRIGDGPMDLKNGTVDFNSLNDSLYSDYEMMHDVYPSPNENEEEYITYGNFDDDMSQNLDQYEYDIDELENYSTEEMYEGLEDHDIEQSSYDGMNDEFKESETEGYDEQFDDFKFTEEDENLVQDIQESLDMFKRFKKYN